MHLILLNPSAMDTRPSAGTINSFDMICAADKIINEIQSINNLLKEKNKIINRIGAIMNFKAHTKTQMSKAQIRQFMRFNNQCIENSNKLSDIFDEMDFIIKPDIAPYFELHKKMDTADLYEKFIDISKRQKIAASCLKELLAVGNYTIFILCRK